MFDKELTEWCSTHCLGIVDGNLDDLSKPYKDVASRKENDEAVQTLVKSIRAKGIYTITLGVLVRTKGAATKHHAKNYNLPKDVATIRRAVRANKFSGLGWPNEVIDGLHRFSALSILHAGRPSVERFFKVELRIFYADSPEDLRMAGYLGDDANVVAHTFYKDTPAEIVCRYRSRWRTAHTKNKTLTLKAFKDENYSAFHATTGLKTSSWNTIMKIASLPAKLFTTIEKGYRGTRNSAPFKNHKWYSTVKVNDEMKVALLHRVLSGEWPMTKYFEEAHLLHCKLNL